ncbi:MAG: ATP-dependent helicase [Candidatus Omnitrophica bacterium]|nr:ATP-dependent helicase [Candidatus Omnitrophota bacterium]
MALSTAAVAQAAAPRSMPHGSPEALLGELTAAQREAVLHTGAPLLIIAGAGTGKTTVISRRIAWLLRDGGARPDEILALTFTEKAAAEMEERVDLLVPYGYMEVALRTFHAFGDQLLREHAALLGLSPQFRVLSQAEQGIFLKRHLFELPLQQFRPPSDPTRFIEPLVAVMSRAKDEAVSPEEFMAWARAHAPQEPAGQAQAPRVLEVAAAYEAYERLLRREDAADFGDQVLLAIQLLERHPEIRAALHRRLRHILVDEFQDTNYAQFRLLQLLIGPSTSVTVVGDDDQSIYKWRGAAISNVVKFLEAYPGVRTIVLKENFRSPQPVLDAAYRLIQFNNPDRLEVRHGIDKRLVAAASAAAQAPQLHIFETVSSEADWVARTIRQAVASGARRPSDIAVLVRSNREADLFLRALNVAGVPWQFSGSSGLFAREESKMLLSCLRALADPEDSLSWYHVASSPLYACRMEDLAAALAAARRTNRSLRAILQQSAQGDEPAVSEEGRRSFRDVLEDVQRLLELSRSRSPGQLLYQWLSDRGFLQRLGAGEQVEELASLQTVARFFHHLQRVEALVGGRLPEVMEHLELLQAMGNEPAAEEDAWADRVSVLTIHKAKGLEFPVVFLVGLVQGRFPTPRRRDPIELPEELIRDLLPAGDYHLQEERRLCYVGMTRAKQELHLSCAYDYGGKTGRKISQFVVEALELASPSPAAKATGARELIARGETASPLPLALCAPPRPVLRLDAHGVDDYLTCPLKYRYSHILRIPAMRHHVVVYGAALHKAVEQFFRRQLQGQPMSADELLKAFEAAWSSEGFLTREHEEQRLAQGCEALQRFFTQQQAHPERPMLIEEKFTFELDDLLVVGRWDRVDDEEGQAVIIDYKSSEVREQAAADRRTRESLQLLLYALAWQRLRGVLPRRVELRFLETGLRGQAVFELSDLERAKAFLKQAADGIRRRNFRATPQEIICRWCAFQAICPQAFRPTL